MAPDLIRRFSSFRVLPEITSLNFFQSSWIRLGMMHLTAFLRFQVLPVPNYCHTYVTHMIGMRDISVSALIICITSSKNTCDVF